VETHERHQHETRLEGLREERNVKRLRKPEGVAESGEANPAGRRHWRKRRCRVAVASRSLTRCRVPNLMRGPLESGCVGDGTGGESKRERRCGHRVGLRSGEGKPRLFERGANGMGGCPRRETEAAGQHATNTAQDRVSAFLSGSDTSEIQGHGGMHSTDTDASRAVRNTPKSSQPREGRLRQGDLVEIALQRFWKEVL
jgi:hypothetical protein